MITLEQINQHIRDDIDQLLSEQNPSSETVPLGKCVGRIVAKDLNAPFALPRNDHSAMDGFALSVQEGEANTTQQWQIIGESIAGHSFQGECASGECVRIMTGALIPPGCDRIAIKEQCYVAGQTLRIKENVSAGAHIRRAGEELQQGDSLFSRGQRLSVADCILAADLGMDVLPLMPRIKIGLLSTGDEICEIGKPLTGNSRIYDSNRVALPLLLRGLPVHINDYGIIPDKKERIEQALQTAAEECQIIVSTGGVSVGDYDHLRDCVKNIGEIEHEGVAIKPGKPFVYGRIGNARYFGLPGNPISVYITSLFILIPALWRYAGATHQPEPIHIQATLTEKLKKKPGRKDFQRARIHYDTEKGWLASVQGKQESHRTAGMTRANALIVLPLESGDVSAGSIVDVIPLNDHFS